ncbi:MAG: SapC family protein [Gammaproteobacteria bacterium]|nr:SapC family protein [Gammaproteobacteria bacterium]MDP2139746.1 SapC family protein [Gammaproteobacteria bacterium]MDP2348949.1 SapC family protein [Gammaproteobacteria bacterium]
MPDFQPITINTHASKRWNRPAHYLFAAQDNVCPLVLHEMPMAQTSLAIGFMEIRDHYHPVAVQGLGDNRNLLINAQGQWLFGYMPASYRAYPFALANTDQKQHVLCFNADSGLLTDSTDGEIFFDEDGKPGKTVKDVLDFLTKVTQDRIATERFGEMLKKYSLIQPWPISVEKDGKNLRVNGLHRIDEAALKALPAETLKELQVSGFLPFIYCQIFSMQNIQRLGQLTQFHNKSAPAMPAELNLDFLNDDGNINFGNL